MGQDGVMPQPRTEQCDPQLQADLEIIARWPKVSGDFGDGKKPSCVECGSEDIHRDPEDHQHWACGNCALNSWSIAVFFRSAKEECTMALDDIPDTPDPKAFRYTGRTQAVDRFLAGRVQFGDLEKIAEILAELKDAKMTEGLDRYEKNFEADFAERLGKALDYALEHIDPCIRDFVRGVLMDGLKREDLVIGSPPETSPNPATEAVPPEPVATPEPVEEEDIPF